VASDGIDASKEGTDWTADEVAVLVGSYFLMLAEERAGRDYNKSEYRRSVIAAIGRKPGSIERKLQNVSAVLDEIGVPWIQATSRSRTTRTRSSPSSSSNGASIRNGSWRPAPPRCGSGTSMRSWWHRLPSSTAIRRAVRRPSGAWSASSTGSP
jgi:hypothetical protein